MAIKSLPIYFSDLNEEAQKRMLDFVGVDSPSEMNWDMDNLPLFIYEIEDKEELGYGYSSAIYLRDRRRGRVI